MSVTAAAGFTAGSVAAGLAARGGPDFTIVVNEGPEFSAAAVFTSNRAKAHPILWSEQAIADGQAKAVVLNAGGANCFTGPEGFALTHRTAEVTASQLGNVSASDILVCSTGLIGELLPAGAVLAAIPLALSRRDSSASSGEESARAIMTTDSRHKMASATLVSKEGVVTIGGMAKGAGMLAPGLATMLVVITTDAKVSSPDLETALRGATEVTFNRLDSDGCMSTNDQVTLMASGASGITPAIDEFQAALTALCGELASALHRDAEGAHHDIAIEVTGAAHDEEAVALARAVARNNLFKAAVFGNDPNWGRVLAALGTVDAQFDIYGVDVSMNGVRVCHQGAPDRPRSEVDLTPRATHVLIELHSGPGRATVLTNDLTHDYVHENSAYSS
jgi:glutamate N-acetyltransferase / amino-acid N-acetyltransferase